MRRARKTPLLARSDMRQTRAVCVVIIACFDPSDDLSSVDGCQDCMYPFSVDHIRVLNRWTSAEEHGPREGLDTVLTHSDSQDCLFRCD